MSGFFADLIIPQLTFEEATERYTAADLRALFRQADNLASQLGLAELWSRAQLVGSSAILGERGLQSDEPIGISNLYACIVGVGFWRDYRLEPAELHIDPYATHLQPATAQRLMDRSKRDAVVRGPEVEAVQKIVAHIGIDFPVRLSAVTDIEGSLVLPFEEGYRRKLAYLLAFEASLRQNSLAPYTDYLYTLIRAAPETLKQALPPTSDPDFFSTAFNLAYILNAAQVYEVKHGHAHPDLPGAVVEGTLKREWLLEQMKRAALSRPRLHPDSRTALAALQDEIEIVSKQAYSSSLPRWGLFGPSTSYGTQASVPRDPVP